jgi:hypothetical protein
MGIFVNLVCLILKKDRLLFERSSYFYVVDDLSLNTKIY